MIFYSRLFLLPVFLGCESSETFEVFREEGRVRETKIIGNVGNALVGVKQFCLDTGNKGTVYPFLGGDATGLADDGAQIALCEAETLGIVVELAVLRTMLIHQLDEAVEDGLLTAAALGQQGSFAAVESIVVMHEGCNERRDCGAVVVILMYGVPDGVHDVAGGLNVGLAGVQMEVALAAIIGRWEGIGCKGHRKVGKECHTVDFEVGGEPHGMDDGARAEIDHSACCDMPVGEVDIDVGLTFQHNAEAMVIDDEGRLLLNDKLEHTAVAMHDTQFIGEPNVLTYRFKVGHEDVTHP